MEVLREAMEVAGDEHADECAINTQTGDDSKVLACNCWVSRAQALIDEGK